MKDTNWSEIISIIKEHIKAEPSAMDVVLIAVIEELFIENKQLKERLEKQGHEKI